MKIGDKVCYIPTGENGIVKSIHMISLGMVHVVYYCNNDWDNYFNYTAALTEMAYLKEGWILEPQL
jgi:hypothetical protein